jgi:hypothetical protein
MHRADPAQKTMKTLDKVSRIRVCNQAGMIVNPESNPLLQGVGTRTGC